MAMLRYGNAAISTPIVAPGKWLDKKVSAGRVKVARSMIARYDPSKWLLSHVTIIASVDVDLADPKDPKSNYLIIPEHSQFVNNNGDCWERNLLKATYNTFLNADNFVEHVQIPALSKGKVIDVALREVPVAKGFDGKDITTLYVDILIATSRAHGDLINKITSGEYNSTSMGCGIAGTPITIGDGSFVNIEDVKIGDVVLTHKGRERRVTSLYSTDITELPLYSVSYTGGYEPLRLTAEHPILIATERSARCTYQNKPCKVGSHQSQCYWNSRKRGKVKIECGRDKDTYQYDFKFVPISEVKKGDYIVKTFPTEIVDNEVFSKDICRLLGLYLGDGYIGWQWDVKEKTKKYPAYIGFCFNLKEKALHAEVLEILKKVCPGKTVTPKEVPERNGYYLNVYDKDLASLFFEAGGEYSWHKKVSKEVMLLPKEKQLEIISGLFDSDGCYYTKDRSLNISLSSSVLMNQAHLMLLRCGIINSHQSVMRKASGKKKVSEKYKQETIRVGKAYSRLINSRKNTNYGDDLERDSNDFFMYDNYLLCPVKSVTALNFCGKVYNFSVEEDESYLVRDVAVHNCLIAYSQCSQCGNIAADEPQLCHHIRYYKNNFFHDQNGVRRIIAELCGRAEDPDSCKFVDASWVRKPAFGGAVLRNIVEPGEDVSEKIQKAVSVPSFEAQPGMMLRAASQAASTLMREINAQEEGGGEGSGDAATSSGNDTEPPGDDTDFPPAEENAEAPLSLDQPGAEGDQGGDQGGDQEADPASEPSSDQATGEGEAAPEPQIQEPEEDATVKEVEEMMTKQVLNNIRRKLMKNEMKVRTKQDNRPTELATDARESLVRDASSVQRILKAAKKQGNPKLINGLMILSNLSDWKAFRKYGYSRDDVLALLSFSDQALSEYPVDMAMVKAVSRIKTAGMNPQRFFTELIVETGCRPNPAQGKKLLKWAKILSTFE